MIADRSIAAFYLPLHRSGSVTTGRERVLVTPSRAIHGSNPTPCGACMSHTEFNRTSAEFQPFDNSHRELADVLRTSKRASCDLRPSEVVTCERRMPSAAARPDAATGTFTVDRAPGSRQGPQGRRQRHHAYRLPRPRHRRHAGPIGALNAAHASPKRAACHKHRLLHDKWWRGMYVDARVSCNGPGGCHDRPARALRGTCVPREHFRILRGHAQARAWGLRGEACTHACHASEGPERKKIVDPPYSRPGVACTGPGSTLDVRSEALEGGGSATQ